MFITKTEPSITVAASPGVVFSLQSSAGATKDVVVENLSPSNTLTYKFQYSDDNSSWTDVAADATVSPGDRVRVLLTGHIFHRLYASGNLNIAAKVDSELDFNGVFSFMNI